MASSSSQQEIAEHDAFEGIAPAHQISRTPTSARLFDVFINHRGPDVKETLALQLHKSLTDLGLKTFLDSEEMELGEAFPSTIHDAICSSSVHIAIFSKRYADSACCLAELDLMLHTKCKIIPIFYDVAPLHLRHIEKGVYADSFAKYKEKGRYLSKLEQWKQSLYTVSFISGYEINKDNHFVEQLCKTVVSAVLKEVKKTYLLEVAKSPVGLNELVEDFERRCCLNTEESCNILGIYGMGGSGKTTLAKELYNRKRSEYKASCFLFDVREASARSEMPLLQTKLLKDLLEENCPKFGSQEEGKNYLKNRLGKRGSFLSFFLVVDDVDHPDQLGALSVKDILNTNSLAIVTTRDESVLLQAGITARYKVKEMNTMHSRQLFCWHAFDRPDPTPGYEDLVESFIKRCGGLPLSIQVIGRLVFGRNDEQYWKSTLDKVSRTLPGVIKQILRISYDTLDREEKQIFMDIACFFTGKEKSMAIRIWEGSGWHAEPSLHVLKDKCLLEEESSINYESTFRMHDHLRDLGREMADDLSLPRRIWRPEHLSTLELKKILATSKGQSLRCLNSIFDRSIGSQILYFLGNRDDIYEASSALLWLELDMNWRSHISVPLWIPLQNLQYLKIKRGHFKRLWQRNLQAIFENHETLKSEKYDLKELFLYETASLGEFPKSLQMLRNLEHLVLEGISAYWIEKSESEWGMLNSLKHLVLRGRHPEWRELVIQGADLSISLRKLTNLRVLVLKDCTLSGELALNGIGPVSTNFESSINSCMGSLVILQMSNVKQTSKVSISGKHCPRLGSLQLVSMESLVELNITGVTTPFSLELENCKRLKRVSGEFDLAELVIFDCPKLEALPSLANSRFLEKISVDKCWSLNEEVNAPATLKYLHYYSGPELINSFFSNRKTLSSWTMPSEITSIIGKAVHGAEATLNAAFFSGFLKPDEINEIRMKKGRPEASLKMRDSLRAIIVCAVLRSTLDGQVVRIRLHDGKSICCSVDKGEWVWTIAISHPEHMYFADSRIAESCWIPTMDYPLLDSVIKGYVCTIDDKGEPFQLFSKIISQLYKLNKLEEITATPINSKDAEQKPSLSGSRGFRNKILKWAIFGFQQNEQKEHSMIQS